MMAQHTPHTPYGLESLAKWPRSIFWGAAFAALSCWLSLFWLQGSGRGLVVLLGIFLTDFAQEGLRYGVFFWAKKNFKAVGLGILGLFIFGWLVTKTMAWNHKRAFSANSVQHNTLTLKETSGITRAASLALIPLPSSTSPTLKIAAFKGLQPVLANVLLEKTGASIALQTSALASQSETLDVYWLPPDQSLSALLEKPDPEETWTAKGAYQQGLQSFTFQARSADNLYKIPPFLGRTALELDILPSPGARAYLWIELPVSLPKTVTHSSSLVYAIRIARASSLVVSVQAKTSAGYLYQKTISDQNGLSAHGGQSLLAVAQDHWYFRRIALGEFADANLESIGLMVFQPENILEAEPTTVYVDAVHIEEGPPLEARLE